jgi:hypothetical protein
MKNICMLSGVTKNVRAHGKNCVMTSTQIYIYFLFEGLGATLVLCHYENGNATIKKNVYF